jgi:hypothetical protein
MWITRWKTGALRLVDVGYKSDFTPNVKGLDGGAGVET